MTPEVDDFAAKAAAYRADVTYGTNTEMGFDYLRDNMASQREHMVQREHVYGIVDEVDSILIDEARTPLIISGPSHESTKLYYQFASIVRTLRRDVDYEVDEEKRTAVPTEAGIAKVERQLAVDNLYDSVAVNYVHQLEKALQAKELYHRDKDYLVADGEVKIVDEFTGRIMEGRRWSDGLHQAVEAKERVRIQEENHTWATITFQNYFRMYEKLAGMTGTAETEAAEFASTYQLHVVPIPTHRPMIRTDFADLIFKAEHTKFDAVVEDLKERYDRGQPVLVGTASVAKSEELSLLLDKQGIPHHVLNAKHHAQEAEIVAQAGRLHAITVATNMAGRGVDIVLGGNPEGLARNEVRAQGLDLDSDEGQERYQSLLGKFKQQCAAEADEVRALGGLYVLGSERHESRRIDNQLRGRSGRQGDPGESRFYLSLEDELMRLFATGAVSWVMDRALPEDVPIEAQHGHQGDRAGPAHRRGPQRRDPQGAAQVRRGAQRAAQGHLRPPAPDHRRRGPQAAHRGAAHSDGGAGRREQLPERLPRGMGPRGTPRGAGAVLPDEVHRRRPRGGDQCGPAHREHPHRGPRVLRRAGTDLPRRCRDGARRSSAAS